jgi:putative transposase
MNHNHRNSPRCPTWDYRSDGAYFITICTKNRERFFGEIHNSKMELSPVGIIADILWYEIKNHAKNIELGEFVVMPNHIHGILILKNNLVWNTETINENPNSKNIDNENLIDGTNPFDGTNSVNGINSVFVGTRHALSLQKPEQKIKMESQQLDSTNHNQTEFENVTQIANAKNPPLFADNRLQNQGKNSISSIVGSYKSAVTKHARRLGFEFFWQSRFWDNIIQDEKAYQKISNYIIHNPTNWELDKFY